MLEIHKGPKSVDVDGVPMNAAQWKTIKSLARDTLKAYETKTDGICGLDWKTDEIMKILLKQRPKVHGTNQPHPYWIKIHRKYNGYGIQIAQDVLKILVHTKKKPTYGGFLPYNAKGRNSMN